ncbi:ABC transporter ATPase [Marmoricola endophyticus]|uniref:ABC transporter ATPase n=1 Tax=Marmoricola endophyticus TaxID=2040280 RepID=A0A917BE63_9ACTN|nr:ABC transporter ATP-binding protein [Marmoricola endophyticus]GGF39740.1 ABC transporter ATPase [Marmoricola endophyticus]
MIEGRSLSWHYGENEVLRHVDLVAHPARVLGLIGPNGSGKTTALRLLYGALRTATGEVRVDGDRLEALGPRETARRLAVVVQESGGESSMTVGEMVLLGRAPHLATFQRTRTEDRRIAGEALRRVNAAHLGARAYAGLSGGERQRVLIARALAQQASHLLLDEPTNHLDIRYQHEVLILVRELAAELGTTAAVVLHDLNLAARYCDDLVLLHGDGRVARAGSTDDVLDPVLLTEVYGIEIERIEVEGEIHLLFRPGDGTRHEERTA